VTTLDPSNLALDGLGDTLDLPKWSRAISKGTLDVTIRPPGSKSLTNRALLLAAIAPGTSTITHALTSADDAQRMLAAIEQLGASVSRPNDHTLTIQGTSGVLNVDPENDVVDLNNAGTATRFLSAAALLADHPLTITGNERMRQRPIRELGDLLESLGAHVDYLDNPNCPPIRITPPAALSTTKLEIAPTQSSQFVSALMLVAPMLDSGLTLSFPDGLTSASYVRMTIALLDQLGVRVQHTGDLDLVRVSGGIQPFTLEIEPDASGATYWWAAGALLPSAIVRVQGLPLVDDPLQGDALFPLLLERMGCTLVTERDTLAVKGTRDLSPIICDMRDMPDAVMSLAAVASFAPGTTIVRGVKTLRVKECDRIAAMKAELGKLGVQITDNLNADPDTLSITPPESGIDCSDSAPPVTFDTYDDHRMAMSLSLLALRRPNITINDPACVRKTYPDFYQHFASLYI
jgi:3-phosphoshikimate 1-carboxyvinyltransferase